MELVARPLGAGDAHLHTQESPIQSIPYFLMLLVRLLIMSCMRSFDLACARSFSIGLTPSMAAIKICEAVSNSKYSLLPHFACSLVDYVVHAFVRPGLRSFFLNWSHTFNGCHQIL